MRLRHPKPILSHRSVENTTQLSRASRITRWLYFGVLIGLALYIIWYGVLKFFYVDNRGLVEIDHIRIASSRGGRILELPANVGDHVKKGALLVRLQSPNDCAPPQSSEVQPETPELRSLRRKLLSDRTRLETLLQQRKDKQAQLRNMRFSHAMELSIGSVRLQSQKLEDDILRLDGEVRSLRTIIPAREKDIKHLEKVLLLGVEQKGCGDEEIRALYDGTVLSKTHRQFEVVKRTDPIMDFIADDARVHIESYFRTDDFNALSVGLELMVIFPDHSKSRAKVVDIKSTSIPFPNREFHDSYLPFRTRILTILEPVDEKDIPLWKQFNRMEVEVQGWH